MKGRESNHKVSSIAETHCILEQSRISWNIEQQLGTYDIRRNRLLTRQRDFDASFKDERRNQSVFRRGFVPLTPHLRAFAFALLIDLSELDCQGCQAISDPNKRENLAAPVSKGR